MRGVFGPAWVVKALTFEEMGSVVGSKDQAMFMASKAFILKNTHTHGTCERVDGIAYWFQKLPGLPDLRAKLHAFSLCSDPSFMFMSLHACNFSNSQCKKMRRPQSFLRICTVLPSIHAHELETCLNPPVSRCTRPHLSFFFPPFLPPPLPFPHFLLDDSPST